MFNAALTNNSGPVKLVDGNPLARWGRCPQLTLAVGAAELASTRITPAQPPEPAEPADGCLLGEPSPHGLDRLQVDRSGDYLVGASTGVRFTPWGMRTPGMHRRELLERRLRPARRGVPRSPADGLQHRAVQPAVLGLRRSTVARTSRRDAERGEPGAAAGPGRSGRADGHVHRAERAPHPDSTTTTATGTPRGTKPPAGGRRRCSGARSPASSSTATRWLGST